MRDYPLSFEQLTAFSESLPYSQFSSEQQKLFEFLELKRVELNFPAVTPDVGQFLRLLINIHRPNTVFEFGSGYGYSSFWYFLDSYLPDKVILTEKRADLREVFQQAPFDTQIRERIDYFQGDAFEKLDTIDSIDFALVDGVKGDYQKFLSLLEAKMRQGSLALVDNSYWRGSFLDHELSESKQSAKNIKKLHQYIKESRAWQSCFIPFKDGVSLLRRA